MKKILLQFLLCSLLLLLPSCTKGERRIGFELKENPTTGYVWQVETKGDGEVRIVKDGYKSEEKKGMAGAGGTHTFIFEAEKDGEAIIVFTHKRAWEEEYLERRTYRFDIENRRFLTQTDNK